MNEFIQRAEPPARKILADHGIPEEEAADLLNQSFMAVLHRWEKFENSDQALQEILRIVELRCEMYERERRRTPYSKRRDEDRRASGMVSWLKRLGDRLGKGGRPQGS